MPEIAQEKNAQIKEITDKLEQGIQNLFEGERFKEYLNVMSKFHNYSYKNTMLIAMQNLTASRVAGFNSWKNKFGRTVTKGEKGIQILAPAPFKVEREQEKLDNDTGLPMLDRNGNPIIETVEVTIPYFKVVNVFDVSQTYGKELPTLGADELSGGVKDFDRFFEALKTISPVPIEFEKIEDGGKGYYHHEKKLIAINEDMSEVQTAKTTIHEIAHAKLHDRDLVKSELAEPKDKRTMEVEAEAVAYTVCQHYGIDTSDYSFAYIAEWGSGKDMTELKCSLETIRATSSEIINKIDEQMRDFDKDLAKAQEAVMPSPETPEKPDKSSIIGNTPYKNIADKEYFKVDSGLTDKIVAALEAKVVKFSGKISDNNKTIFTLDKADTAVFREVEKSIKAQSKSAQQSAPVPTTEKPDKSNIIGNVAYKDIAEKKYFKIDNNTANKIAAGLEVLGVKYSGRVNADTTTFTVSAVDVSKFREAEKAANAHQIPPVQQTATKPEQPAQLQSQPQSNNIIGNVKYSDIAEKKYMKMDTVIAVKVADELEKQGVKFSGRIGGDKTTLTVNSADVDKCKAIAKEVRTAEAELKVADKMPENANLDCSFSILQLKDTPENRAIRFEPFQVLQDKGIELNSAHYHLIYSELLTATAAQNPQLLEEIFARFNTQLPDDFKGHSLSVSDVIVVTNGDDIKAHYCDRAGFKELPPDFIITETVQEIAPKEYPPVYLETLRHAVEVGGDKMLFHDSHKLNCDCAEAIDKAISTHNTPAGHPGGAYYDLDTALKEVTEKYGVERVTAVTAHTVNKHDWDGRLSDQNKDWAKTVDTPKVDYIPLKTHLAVFDGFVNQVREACFEQEREPNHRADSPTLSELKNSVDKGESISLMDLASAVKSEKAEKSAPVQSDKPPVKRPKVSIKAAIESDKAEKKAAAEKSTPTPKKEKGEAEL